MAPKKRQTARKTMRPTPSASQVNSSADATDMASSNPPTAPAAGGRRVEIREKRNTTSPERVDEVMTEAPISRLPVHRRATLAFVEIPRQPTSSDAPLPVHRRTNSKIVQAPRPTTNSDARLPVHQRNTVAFVEIPRQPTSNDARLPVHRRTNSKIVQAPRPTTNSDARLPAHQRTASKVVQAPRPTTESDTQAPARRPRGVPYFPRHTSPDAGNSSPPRPRRRLPSTPPPDCPPWRVYKDPMHQTSRDKPDFPTGHSINFKADLSLTFGNVISPTPMVVMPFGGTVEIAHHYPNYDAQLGPGRRGFLERRSDDEKNQDGKEQDGTNQ